MLPSNTNGIPQEVEDAIRKTIAADFPDRDARLWLCSTEKSRLVVRVFLPVPKLLPPPYVIYAFDHETGAVERLKGAASAPYRIPNYK